MELLFFFGYWFFFNFDRIIFFNNGVNDNYEDIVYYELIYISVLFLLVVFF